MTISMIMARLCSSGRSTQEVLMTLQTPRAIRRLEESMPILPITRVGHLSGRFITRNLRFMLNVQMSHQMGAMFRAWSLHKRLFTKDVEHSRKIHIAQRMQPMQRANAHIGHSVQEQQKMTLPWKKPGKGNRTRTQVIRDSAVSAFCSMTQDIGRSIFTVGAEVPYGTSIQ